jgi:hypothetical protein
VCVVFTGVCVCFIQNVYVYVGWRPLVDLFVCFSFCIFVSLPICLFLCLTTCAITELNTLIPPLSPPRLLPSLSSPLYLSPFPLVSSPILSYLSPPTLLSSQAAQTGFTAAKKLEAFVTMRTDGWGDRTPGSEMDFVTEVGRLDAALRRSDAVLDGFQEDLMLC